MPLDLTQIFTGDAVNKTVLQEISIISYKHSKKILWRTAVGLVQ